MSVRAKITIAIALVALLAAGCAAALLVTTSKETTAREQSRKAQELITVLFRANLLREQFLVSRLERAREQWLTELHSLSNVLSGMKGYDRAESSLVDRNISTQKERLRVVGQLLANYDAKVSGRKDPAFADRVEKILVGRLNIVAETSIEDSTRLGLLATAKEDSASRTVAILISLLVFIAVAGVLVLSIILGRTIFTNLEKLTDGASAVAAGDLDHVVDIGSGDEFGKVARAFNEMTVELKEARQKDELMHEELERKVAERTSELEAAMESLERANEELEGYGRTASHDLRSPLSASLIASQMLAESAEKVGDEELKSDLLESASLISRNVSKAIGLASDLLELARAGQYPAQVGDVDVGAIVSQVLEEKGEEIRERRLRVDADDDLGVLRAGETHVYQVFSNLIGNAVRHNDSPDPVVSVRYLGREGDFHHYVVCDNGSGIPPDELESIFRPFYKRGGGGDTGVGLSIVARVLEVYGGSVRAYNDNGVCFEVTFGEVLERKEDK